MAADTSIDKKKEPALKNKAWVTWGVSYPRLVDIDPQTGSPVGEGRTWDQLTDVEKEASHEAGYHYEHWEEGEAPIRKLTPAERKRWGRSVIIATRKLGSFRDAIGLMRPARDRTASTAYTDENARVGLGDRFFYEWDEEECAAAIIHESMHVLYNHFNRFKKVAEKPSRLTNIAGDFEINSALKLVQGLNIDMGVHPEDKVNVKPNHPWAPFNGQPVWGDGIAARKTMEKYYVQLVEIDPDNQNGGKGGPGGTCPVHGGGSADSDSSQDGEGQGEGSGQGSEGDSDSGGQGSGSSQNGSGGQGEGQNSNSGSNEHSEQQDKAPQGEGTGNPDVDGLSCTCQGWSCGQPTEAREQAMDDAGIERATDTEKQVAKNNTRKRLVDERKTSRSAGHGAGEDFLSLVIDQLKEPKVPWQNIFRRVITRTTNDVIAGNTDYSFRRTNRRLTGQKYIFPGMVSYHPHIMFGIDTSGSMAKPDYMALLKEVEAITKSISKAQKGLSIFSVDTEIANVQRVSSVRDVELKGGGGTDMSIAFKYANERKGAEKPDVFVLSTDGWVPWQPVYDQLKRKECTYKSIILITDEQAMANVPDEIRKLATVIDISIPEKEHLRR